MPTSLRFITRQWFLLFVVGAALFFGAEEALSITGDPNFIPTVLLLGAFTIPVAFVGFFYGEERAVDKAVHGEAPLILLANCFLVGGVIGVITAGAIEYATLTKLTVGSLFLVGLIEESAKLIFPVAIFLRGRYRSEADGLLFGVASGMGFAALETMGYGLVALIQSKGSVGALEQILLVRGLLSPMGHAAWTGMVCAVLWRQREMTRRPVDLRVIGIFALAVVMHALWDIFGSTNTAIIAYPGYIIIAIASLTLLIVHLRHTMRRVGEKIAE